MGGARGGDWRVGMHGSGEMWTRWRECCGVRVGKVGDCAGQWRRRERMGCDFVVRS